MPDLMWNASMWDKNYVWEEAGEEWSRQWGGSEAQWFGSLYPRLHRFLPARRILEIAPGHGRWSQFLIANCDDFLAIDLSASCVDICERRFADVAYARFASNDGQDLSAAADGSYDMVFSFDSLVHAEIEVFERYVSQILAKLAPSGVAFIHHSNRADADHDEGEHGHSRATSMSASIIRRLVRDHGGVIVMQEVIDWQGAGPIDCLTMFAKRGDYDDRVAHPVVNREFFIEAKLIGEYQAPYSKLVRK
ncbi:class I SAM-dependent methyltransferase [Sphingomonas faeni]|uniref:class I SAM-dependent methyltransferase n=1 Tax=Sphingomonas faeni TaxID=185950 RepID=UPI00335686E5